MTVHGMPWLKAITSCSALLLQQTLRVCYGQESFSVTPLLKDRGRIVTASGHFYKASTMKMTDEEVNEVLSGENRSHVGHEAGSELLSSDSLFDGSSHLKQRRKELMRSVQRTANADDAGLADGDNRLSSFSSGVDGSSSIVDGDYLLRPALHDNECLQYRDYVGGTRGSGMRRYRRQGRSGMPYTLCGFAEEQEVVNDMEYVWVLSNIGDGHWIIRPSKKRNSCLALKNNSDSELQMRSWKSSSGSSDGEWCGLETKDALILDADAFEHAAFAFEDLGACSTAASFWSPFRRRRRRRRKTTTPTVAPCDPNNAGIPRAAIRPANQGNGSLDCLAFVGHDLNPKLSMFGANSHDWYCGLQSADAVISNKSAVWYFQKLEATTTTTTTANVTTATTTSTIGSSEEAGTTTTMHEATVAAKSGASLPQLGVLLLFILGGKLL